MELKVRNFRGCRTADITLDKITLVAGPNGVGKSSICQAAAAAFTRNPVPFFRSTKPESALVNKGDAGCLVTDGTDRGGVMLRDDNGTVQIGWPKLSMDTQGSPAVIGKVAAGLITPIEMDDAERSRFFQATLQTMPTSADLMRALKDSGIPDESAEVHHAEIWADIEISGFDASYKSKREIMTKLKGQWEGHTGERWGDTKAASYTPEGWSKELENETLESHNEILATAKTRVEEAIAKSALSEAELDQLSSDAAREDQVKMLLDRANGAMSACETTLNKCRQDAEADSAEQSFVCGHCGGVNTVTFSGNDVEVQPVEKTDAEMAEARDRIAQSKANLAKAEKALSDARYTVANVKADYNKYSGSNVKLESARKKKGSREDLDMARDFLKSVEKNHDALKKKVFADQIYQRSIELQTIIGILSPEGLRQEILVKKLAEFNQLLAKLCVDAKFPQIQLSDDLELSYGGRSYFIISESERWRCRAIMALAIAVRNGDVAVILDGADIMDQAGRNGLFSLLLKLNKDNGLRAIVGMTLSKRELAPDLGAKKIGHTYWIENGAIAA